MRRLSPATRNGARPGSGQPGRRSTNGPSAKGGHARTGLEDNVRLDRDTLAPSNAALVHRTVELCERYERPVATWEQARTILGLPLRNVLAA